MIAILARCVLALLVFRGCSAVHPNPKEACEVFASSSIISGIRSITDAAASSMTSPAQESIRAYGQLLFARLLLDGVGCDRDFKKAFALTEESSKQVWFLHFLFFSTIFIFKGARKNDGNRAVVFFSLYGMFIHVPRINISFLFSYCLFFRCSRFPMPSVP